jgi:hypothetical protein
MKAIATLLTALVLAAATVSPADEPQEPRTTQPPNVNQPPPLPSDSFKPNPAWKSLGKDVWFDAKEKRLVVRARVAQQDAVLEHLLCKKDSKEHESVLVTEAPARLIHAGLLLTGAETGHPVKFQPTFQPPAGSAIAIEVEWEQAGKLKKVDARDWVMDLGTKKALTRDWVFAGSELFEDPRTKTMIYAADDGDLITVANFPASILDLPYRSSASDADRGYSANPEKVPVRGTPVTMYLSPRPAPVKESTKPKPDAAR